MQLRQALIGVLAFVLTPCLLLLPSGFGQFQQLAYRGPMRASPAAILRLNAVRGLAFDDLTEAVVSLLIAYSMITVGFVAVYAWDALSFDRRDAMVLGPLPLRPSTIMIAKLAALGALLLSASLGVSALNSLLFALEASDRAGIGAFVANFSACLIVTTGAAIVVFSTVVIVRGVVVTLGGERLAAFTGSAFQLLLVVALLELVVTAFASPHKQGRLTVSEMTTPPMTWFVAWFEGPAGVRQRTVARSDRDRPTRDPPRPRRGGRCNRSLYPRVSSPNASRPHAHGDRSGQLDRRTSAGPWRVCSAATIASRGPYRISC